MQKYLGRNSQYTKRSNRSRLLKLLLEKGPMSRQDLAQITTLTGGAISMITRDLIEDGVLAELGKDQKGKTGAGRRPILIDIRGNVACAVGIEVAPDHIQLLVSDVKGKVLGGASLDRDVKLSAEAVLKVIGQEMDELLKSLDIPANKVVGGGIGIPGFVDTERGVVRHSVNLGWEDVPVAQMLQTQLGFPIVIDNNVRQMALAEQWFGQAKGSSSLLLVYVGAGIGSGVMLEGQVYRGAMNAAGEIGHTVVDVDGPQCRCGRRGCVEVFSSNRAIETAVGGTKIEETVRQAQAGQVEAVAAVQKAGRYLGAALVNYVNAIDPDTILITGKIAGAGDIFAQVVREVISSESYGEKRREVNVAIRPFRPEWAAYGGCVSALDHFFYSYGGDMEGESLQTPESKRNWNERRMYQYPT